MPSRRTNLLSLTTCAVLGISVSTASADLHTHKVDCGKIGQTLQKVVDKAHIGDTIKVQGTCVENVLISTDNITVEADGSATIDGSGNPDLGTVIVSSNNVRVRGLTIVGGFYGVIVIRSGSAIIESNDISAGHSGILVTQASYARIGGGNAAVGNTIQGDVAGVNVRLASGADVFFNTITGDDDANTGDRGINISAGGSVDMSDNVISDFNRGLSLLTSGSATLSASIATTGGANTFTDNTIAIRCRLGGSLINGSPAVPQIDGSGNGTLVNENGCHITNALTFVLP